MRAIRPGPRTARVHGRVGSSMNRTVTPGFLLLADESRRRRYEPDAPAPAHPPIYAALMREWQSGGRTVPGVRDAQWTTLSRGADLPWESRTSDTAAGT
jgi:hypothetical protein